MSTTEPIRPITGARSNGHRKVSPHHIRVARRVPRSHVAGASTTQAHLPTDCTQSQALSADAMSRWTRLGARLFAHSLDEQLAQGRTPESSRLLAARAQLIASPSERQELAKNWVDLLDLARTPVALYISAITPSVPMVRERIIESETQVREMLRALLAPLPTVRGIAMAHCLLTDGSGPVFNPRCSTDLVVALQEVTAQLDPAAI